MNFMIFKKQEILNEKGAPDIRANKTVFWKITFYSYYIH